MLTADQEESITKYATSLSDRFKQELVDQKWIKLRKERHKIISKILSRENIENLSELDFRKIIKDLWAFVGWNNKDWVVDNIIKNNGFTNIRNSLSKLLYSQEPLEQRFDNCQIRDMGPASITEIMSFVDPEKYCIWNIKPRKVFPLLGIDQLPQKVYKYSQISGSDYVKVNEIMKDMLKILSDHGYDNLDLLALDLFIWIIFDERDKTRKEKKPEKISEKTSREIQLRIQDLTHWDAIGLIVELGNTLGFDTYIADPSKKYKGKPLSQLATSEDVPEQCKNISGIESIDVIWFKFEPPFYLFEVEDKGTMREALHRLYQARYFQSKFFVVCPLENRDKFEKYVITDPFR
ncbi:MAG: hypothetical protein FJ356_04380, partial [Thaumarchaeota archaeon]|nr:hypothetical protein [Nitrososphaerota archaeon]